MKNELSGKLESDSAKPSRPVLVQRLERLGIQHKRSVIATTMRKADEFSVSQHHEVFGNSRLAFETSDINREQQFRVGIVYALKNLGHEPSRAEMAEYETVAVSTSNITSDRGKISVQSLLRSVSYLRIINRRRHPMSSHPMMTGLTVSLIKAKPIFSRMRSKSSVSNHRGWQRPSAVRPVLRKTQDGVTGRHSNPQPIDN